MCAHDICGEDDLCCTLIQLCSAADEACVGVGCTLPNPDDVDPFLEDASEMLFIKRDELKGPGGSERYN